MKRHEPRPDDARDLDRDLRDSFARLRAHESETAPSFLDLRARSDARPRPQARRLVFGALTTVAASAFAVAVVWVAIPKTRPSDGIFHFAATPERGYFGDESDAVPAPVEQDRREAAATSAEAPARSATIDTVTKGKKVDAGAYVEGGGDGRGVVGSDALAPTSDASADHDVVLGVPHADRPAAGRETEENMRFRARTAQSRFASERENEQQIDGLSTRPVASPPRPGEAPPKGPVMAGALDAKDLARLQSLGYVGRDVSAGYAGDTFANRSLVIAPEPRNTESYAAVEDNPFHRVVDAPLSTLSIDVDTGSYSNVRRFLRDGMLPPADAVRIEELLNYFRYDDPTPDGAHPFAVHTEVAACPWNPRHRLARIGIRGQEIGRTALTGTNLVFLIDVSGSMGTPDKLPLLKDALALLTRNLGSRDRVALVVYAGASGLVLPPTAGTEQATILGALARLESGGGTAGAEGLELAYRTAAEGFIEGGVNRVILATDGDFNIGPTSHGELLDIVKGHSDRGVFLTTLGFGTGNLQDDRLEQLADRGNGHYAYIDTVEEARKVLVEEIAGTLVTIAKDVKIQVEFNPAEVGAYRLIGYANRKLAARDFADDEKDAGEIGSGHTLTVLYELVPPGAETAGSEVAPLRYRRAPAPSEGSASGELMNVALRYKAPEGTTSTRVDYAVTDGGSSLEAASDDLRFAAAVAAFGMALRGHEDVRDFDWDAIARLAAGAVGRDEGGYRDEFLAWIDRARNLSGRP